MFRSRISGRYPATNPAQKSVSTIPVQNYTYSRYTNLIGNVFGTQGYHTVYEAIPATNTTLGSDRANLIYALGWPEHDSTGIVLPECKAFMVGHNAVASDRAGRYGGNIANTGGHAYLTPSGIAI